MLNYKYKLCKLSFTYISFKSQQTTTTTTEDEIGKECFCNLAFYLAEKCNHYMVWGENLGIQLEVRFRGLTPSNPVPIFLCPRILQVNRKMQSIRALKYLALE
jgi:hypothetical protein